MEVSLAAVEETPALTSASSGCKAGKLVTMSRTSTCQWVKATAVVYKNRAVVGRATFGVIHKMTLNAGKRDWSESIQVTKANITGDAHGIKMSLAAKPDGISPSSTSTTKVTRNKFPQGHTIGGSSFTGSISYHDSVGKKKFERSLVTYTYIFTKTGRDVDDAQINSAHYRCDDMFWEGPGQRRHTKAPGCAFYGFPSKVSFKGLTNIANGIKALRHRGGHYGDPGAGSRSRALHMTWDQKRIKDNRNKVCPSSRHAPADMKRKGRTSCDEYPMAATYEGGTYLPASQRETTWATPTEQNKQGSRMSAFRKTYRVLDRDAFYVTV